ncbi:MAG: MBL fold metallo-hydrolase [Caldilineaceae bacterium]
MERVSMGKGQNSPESAHFQLHKLANGVYAAIQTASGLAGANAGIIDLGGHTVIFDTFLTPQAAGELRTAAETLTGHPVTTVINSHHHIEHFWGNQVFANSTNIIATTATRAAVATQGQQAVLWQQENAPKQLAEAEKRSKGAAKEKERQQRQREVQRCQAILAALPSLTLRLPNVTFDSRLILYGTQRRAELMTYGPGHTQGDAVLYLPDDGILFAGDLVCAGFHPYLADGDPGEVSRILDILRKLKLTLVVPGHGDVGDMQIIDDTARYLSAVTELALIELAYKLENPAQLDEKIAELAVPKAFATWSQASYFAANLRFLYERLMKAYAD